MSADSNIGWTDHTFNPWWGCQRVSEGCAHCYAETFSKRVGLKVWGQDQPRRFFGAAHWAEPLKWHRAAQRAGRRALVFCASMADVFEDRADLDESRRALFDLIGQTPMLTWLLLTKRPQMAAVWLGAADVPSNVWVGASTENRARFEERMPHLLRVQTRRFLSVEPMVGDLGVVSLDGIGWVIVGGESGPGRRPLDVSWVESLVDQCEEQGVGVFVKQDAGQYPGSRGRLSEEMWRHKWRP